MVNSSAYCIKMILLGNGLPLLGQKDEIPKSLSVLSRYSDGSLAEIGAAVLHLQGLAALQCSPALPAPHICKYVLYLTVPFRPTFPRLTSPYFTYLPSWNDVDILCIAEGAPHAAKVSRPRHSCHSTLLYVRFNRRCKHYQVTLSLPPLDSLWHYEWRG